MDSRLAHAQGQSVPESELRTVPGRPFPASTDRNGRPDLPDSAISAHYSGVRLIRRTSQPLPCLAAGSDFTHDAISDTSDTVRPSGFSMAAAASAFGFNIARPALAAGRQSSPECGGTDH